MKRKVRVTPPTSNPFESNPMSTWMAEMGGVQPTEDERITSIAAEMLTQGFEEDLVKKELAKEFSLAKVNEIVDALYAYVDEQRDLSEANYLEDELAQEQILAEQEAAEMQASEEDAYSNDMYYAPDSDPGYAEEDTAMQDIIMRSGGKVPSKKQFVKQALKLKKKQEGGDEASNKSDDTMSDKRPLNNFIQTLAQTAQQKADEEALEQQYDQMFGNEELPEAQFGGSRNPRRAQRQMNRQINRLVRNTPMGYFNPSMQFLPSQMNFMTAPMMYPQGFDMQSIMNPGVRMANIEVKRTGLFGKPKEYTINFATTPPSQINPREVIEQEVQNVKQTQKDAEQTEKEKQTTTASEENEKVQEELITADKITVVGAKGSSGAKGKTTTSSTPQAKSAVKRDAWGRPEGDKWFGFDPDKKTWTNNENDGWATPGTDLSGVDYDADPMRDPDRFSVEKSKQNAQEIWDEDNFIQNSSQKAVKKDKWGRPEGSKWYGYDPNARGLSPLQKYSQESLGWDDSPIGFTEKDQWGRSPSDYWYGYDPETGKWTRGNEKGIGDLISHGIKASPFGTSRGAGSSQRLAETKKRLEASAKAAHANKSKTGSDKGFNHEAYNKMLDLIPKQYGGPQEIGGQTGMGLYHFIYGGDDSMIPFADESFRTYSKDATDPYFQRGGLTEYQTKGQTKDAWNRSQGTIIEFPYDGMNDVWDGEKWVAASGSTDNKTDTTQEISTNQKKYDALKELGYNVGDYREGIDYSKLTKFPQTAKNNTNVQNFPMYPGQAGYPMMGPAGVPIYPPLFNNRGGRGRGMFGPGRSIQYAGSWLQQQGLPYDPRTGQPIQGIAAPQIKSINVKKSGLISGRPKKYTINFVGQAPEGTGFGTFNTGFQPRKDWNTPYTPQGQTQQSGQRLPGAFGPRSDEGFARRNQRRAERKGYDVDWSTDGFVSPKDLQTVGNLPTKDASVIPTSADELKARQEATLSGAPGKLNLRNAFIPTEADMPRELINRNLSVNNTIPMPELSDEELDPGMVNVQPEDLSQEYTPLPNELSQNRDPHNISPIVNSSGPMAGMNYSYDMPGEGENYSDEYTQPFSPERDYMLESLGRGPSNNPYFSIGSEAPLVGPNAAAQYLGENLNYNMDLPYQNPLPQPWMNQGMVDASQKKYDQRQAAIQREIARRQQQVKNETRKEVKNTPKVNPKTEQQKIINRVNDIQKMLTQWQPDWLKESLQEELNSLRQGNWSKTPTTFRQSGGASSDFGLPIAQTIGQFTMSTPHERRNYAIMPSAEEIMQKQTPMGQFEDYRNPLTGAAPAIRMGSDGEYINEGVLTDEDLARLNQREMSVDAKVKNMYNIDFENLVNRTNAGIGLGLSMFGQVGDIAKNQQAMANLTAGNVYGSKNQLNQGDWTQWGQFRPNMQGFKQEGMTTKSQKGGSTYKEGGTHYMSSKQIAEFLANGGEIEFI